MGFHHIAVHSILLPRTLLKYLILYLDMYYPEIVITAFFIALCCDDVAVLLPVWGGPLNRFNYTESNQQSDENTH